MCLPERLALVSVSLATGAAVAGRAGGFIGLVPW
jgi:hypothetical protein